MTAIMLRQAELVLRDHQLVAAMAAVPDPYGNPPSKPFVDAPDISTPVRPPKVWIEAERARQEALDTQADALFKPVGVLFTANEADDHDPDLSDLDDDGEYDAPRLTNADGRCPHGKTAFVECKLCDDADDKDRERAVPGAEHTVPVKPDEAKPESDDPGIRRVATAHPAIPPDEADSIEPLARLHHERRQLVAEFAGLWARHGDGGTFTERRHALRGLLSEKYEMQARDKSEKWTEAGVKRDAEADPQYTALLDEGETQRTRMQIVKNEIENLHDRIRRGNGLMYASGAEGRLAQ